MKKSLLLYILTLISGWCIADTYYVSPNGSDANNGLTPATAWQTFANVNQYVADTIFQVGDQVLLERGQVFRGQIDFLVRLDSVTGNFFTFGAYGSGTKPVIMGSERLTGWTPHSGNIWYTTSALPVKQVFVGEKRMTLARYPNAGFLTNDTYGGTTGIVDSDLTEPPGYWVGANIRIRSIDYVYEHAEVFTHTAGGNLGFGSLDYQTAPGQGYYLDNKLELLDAENEWYYDAATQRVYFYAPGGVNPNTLTIEGSVYDYGFKGWYDLRTMTFENLNFRFQSLEGIWLQGLDCLRNTIRNCEFYGQGLIGIDVMGREIVVENNVLDNILGQGIAGFQILNSRITGNIVNRIGLVPGLGIKAVGGMIGIKVLQSDSLYIANNVVDSTGYAALEAKTKRSLIERNHLTNSMLKLSDGGALECFGPDVFENVVKHNVIEIVEGNAEGLPPDKFLIINAIYLDNDVSYFTVDSNVIRINDFGGILMNSGTHHCKIRNNIIYGGKEQLVIAEWREADSTKNHEVYNNVFYSLDEFSQNVRLVSNFGTEDNLADLDSNYYCNPYTKFVLEKGGLSGNTPLYTLDQWKALNPTKNQESKDSYHSFSTYLVNSALTGNQLSNGVFTNNNNGWFCDPHQFGGSNATCNWLSSGGLDGGCFQYEMLTNSPKEDGSITSPDLSAGLSAGKVYQLDFSAISSQSGNVRVLPRRNGGNYAFLNPPMAFCYGPTRSEVSGFYPSSVTEPNVRLEFIITHDHDKEIIIDNVEWKEVDVTIQDPTTKSVLFINPTNAPVVVPLSQAFLDLDSMAVTGSITLAPFYGKILIPDPNGNPFPAELVNFDAKPVEGPAADLTWSFSRDSELNYIKVERSYGGGDFIQIGKVGFEKQRAHYTFSDRNPFAGRAYQPNVFYRLTMVDQDGLQTFSSVEQVNFSREKTGISFSPNPASEILNVSHPYGGDFTIEILDATGKRQLIQKITGTASIQVGHLPKGVYLIRASDEQYEDAAAEVRKLVLE